MLDDRIKSVLPKDREDLYKLCTELSKWANNPNLNNNIIFDNKTFRVIVRCESLGDKQMLTFCSHDDVEGVTCNYNYDEGASADVNGCVTKFITEVLDSASKQFTKLEGKPLKCTDIELKTLVINIARWSAAPTLYKRIHSNLLPITERFRNCCVYNNFTQVLKSPTVEVFICYDVFEDATCKLKLRWINTLDLERGEPHKVDIGPFPVHDFKNQVLNLIKEIGKDLC